jgi:membrane-associated protease RseP (regulator of RpoE activity)
VPVQPPLIKFPNPIHIDKLTKVMEIRGVDTYLHWSVFAISAFILTGVISHPGLTILGLGCYYSILLLHEAGHLYFAQRKGCRVLSIEIYPVFGLTTFEAPWSKLDHCVIAWGGVIGQALVFIPLIAWGTIFGYTRFGAVNMIFAILGFFSLVIAIFNLLPIERLDGWIAWQILPELWAERKRKIPRKPMYR